MNADQLDSLIRGCTLYHELAEGSPQGQGEVAFFFGDGGGAAARLPSGKVMRGSWRIDGGAYRLDWDGGLQGSRSFLTKEGGSITVRNAADGVVRSKVVKIVPGNPEGL